jgi:heme/copper-type cytochrome/quinol oxidase subunit 1
MKHNIVLIIILIIISAIFITGIILSSIDNNNPETEFSTLNKVGHYLMISGMGLVLLIFLIYC